MQQKDLTVLSQNFAQNGVIISGVFFFFVCLFFFFRRANRFYKSLFKLNEPKRIELSKEFHGKGFSQTQITNRIS